MYLVSAVFLRHLELADLLEQLAGKSMHIARLRSV